ncbi:MAG: hypothetical protein ACI8R9_001615 [Paraglaciecola sp.]|jgi:hypothetical protein
MVQHQGRRVYNICPAIEPVDHTTNKRTFVSELTNRCVLPLSQQVIAALQDKIAQFGYKAVVHFELEGVYQTARGHKGLDYAGVNYALRQLGINGMLKTEFWHQQWEYVSLFNGQFPLREAQDLAKAMDQLPAIMRRFGAQSVSFSPVAWAGDKGRYVSGSGSIFSTDRRSVHIPNAIQMNVSVQDSGGENLIPSTELGEWIQYQLLQTSLSCCLFFLPEEDAFKRLSLRSDYGLEAELSSPFVLSGGHQGSIALYKKWGKHNQAMGREPFIYGADRDVLSYTDDWQKTARIEHRIGATSKSYDPFLNMVFILLNVLDAIEQWKSHKELPGGLQNRALPVSLYDSVPAMGAISLFEQDDWFARRVDHYCKDTLEATSHSAGSTLKHRYLQRFKPAIELYV